MTEAFGRHARMLPSAGISVQQHSGALESGVLPFGHSAFPDGITYGPGFWPRQSCGVPLLAGGGNKGQAHTHTHRAWHGWREQGGVNERDNSQLGKDETKCPPKHSPQRGHRTAVHS